MLATQSRYRTGWAQWLTRWVGVVCPVPYGVPQEDLKNFPKDKFVVFVVATYGEGEPTDNAQEAYQLYHDQEHDPGCLANINFMVDTASRGTQCYSACLRTAWRACGRPCGLQVFGLGNKTYEHYNSMGKFWDAKLAELGANRVFELGMGDDDGKYAP